MAYGRRGGRAAKVNRIDVRACRKVNALDQRFRDYEDIRAAANVRADDHVLRSAIADIVIGDGDCAGRAESGDAVDAAKRDRVRDPAIAHGRVRAANIPLAVIARLPGRVEIADAVLEDVVVAGVDQAITRKVDAGDSLGRAGNRDCGSRERNTCLWQPRRNGGERTNPGANASTIAAGKDGIVPVGASRAGDGRSRRGGGIAANAVRRGPRRFQWAGGGRGEQPGRDRGGHVNAVLQ